MTVGRVFIFAFRWWAKRNEFQLVPRFGRWRRFPHPHCRRSFIINDRHNQMSPRTLRQKRMHVGALLQWRPTSRRVKALKSCLGRRLRERDRQQRRSLLWQQMAKELKRKLFKTSLSRYGFLDAFSHLYKRVCLSVRPSVRPSIGHTRVEIFFACCF